MSDYPERISISPVHRQKRDDDFYLVDRKAFPDKGVEYVRADRIEKLEAKLAKAVEGLEDACQIISQCTWTTMRVSGQYVDRREVVQSYRATIAELKGEK